MMNHTEENQIEKTNTGKHYYYYKRGKVTSLRRGREIEEIGKSRPHNETTHNPNPIPP